MPSAISDTFGSLVLLSRFGDASRLVGLPLRLLAPNELFRSLPLLASFHEDFPISPGDDGNSSSLGVKNEVILFLNPRRQL